MQQRGGSSNETQEDINDVFNDLLFAEEKLVDAGYEEGFKAGASEGNPEGYHLGYHRGAEIGSELGYYLGIIETYKNTQTNLTDKINSILIKLSESINNFPKDNNEDTDLFKELEDIRSLFKKFVALSKTQLFNYPEIDNLSF